MENLKWEVDQKEREIQSLKQQLDVTERQSKQELDGIQQSMQVRGVYRACTGCVWSVYEPLAALQQLLPGLCQAAC